MTEETSEGYFKVKRDKQVNKRERKEKKPLMIIANTKKGKGSKFIEDQKLWHYRVPKGEELEQVQKDLEI